MNAHCATLEKSYSVWRYILKVVLILRVLAACAELAGEAIVLDTRVKEGPEAPERNPNEPFLDARSADSGKVVPNLDSLLFALRELGFEPEVLPVEFPAGPGVDGADDYAAGRRVAIVARRTDLASA